MGDGPAEAVRRPDAQWLLSPTEAVGFRGSALGEERTPPTSMLRRTYSRQSGFLLPVTQLCPVYEWKNRGSGKCPILPSSPSYKVVEGPLNTSL